MVRELFLLLLVVVSFEVLAAIKVSIYYEALCSDSVDFINGQLYPNYKDLKDHLNIEFIPYGKAMHGYNPQLKKYIFNCQHGPMECRGNTFQACGLAHIANQDEKVEFVHCVMSARNPSNTASIKKCATQANVDYETMRNCVTSTEGENLQVINGNKTWTLEPNLYDVPTVVLNDSSEIDAQVQREAASNFKNLICSKIAEPKPKVCENVGLLRRIRNFFS